MNKEKQMNNLNKPLIETKENNKNNYTIYSQEYFDSLADVRKIISGSMVNCFKNTKDIL